MQIHESTPREEFTIAGHKFHVYHPFTEGHVATQHEAAALNQIFSENIRNNFARKVKDAHSAGALDHDEMQKALDDYMGAYEFGLRVSHGGGRTHDPVAQRAVEIARAAVRRAIVKAGGSLKDYPASAITERAKRAVETNPKFLEAAREQIAEEDSIDVGEVDSTHAGGKKAKAA